MELEMIFLYKFYYDESFHDRKITSKNITKFNKSENLFDLYIGCFVGENKDKSVIEDKFIELEEKYKKYYFNGQNKELKGSNFKKKNFQYGIASISKQNVMFFKEYFQILYELRDEIHIYFVFLSKINYLIHELFSNIKIYDDIKIGKGNLEFIISKFVYNELDEESKIKLTKIENHDDVEIILKILRERILQIIREVYAKKELETYSNEIEPLLKVRWLLEGATIQKPISFNINWNYDDIFHRFSMFMNEKNITLSEIELIIDSEAKTFDSACKYKINTTEKDSRLCAGIRVCDILCHFVGTITQILMFNSKECNKEQFFTKFFTGITKEKYELWVLLSKLFDNTKILQTVSSSAYCDGRTILYAYFSYINKFDTYQEFLNYKWHNIEFKKYLNRCWFSFESKIKL